MAGKEKPDTPTTPEGERIAKVLSRAGIASRREAERLMELGEVAVNGKVITSPALNVTPSDRITVRGEPVGQPEPPRLWLYYKPEGLVTSASDEKGRDTVFDHLPEDMPRVMSVGRLDLNSEGLLLLTNDGELKRRLELPSTGWLRKYRVRVKGNPTEPEIEPLRKGITIEGERFQPMEVKIDRHQGANAWLTVGLREGKNREIRRAMTHIGLTVNRLIRVSYGPFRLNELKPGEVEEIKPRILREQLGLAEDGAEEKPRPAVRRAPRPAAKGAAKGAEGTAAAKPKATLKPGEGQRRLSEAWQKATRGPGPKPAAGRGEERPAKAPSPSGRTPSRPGPRPKGPRGG
jgi:23S rRNA pseudouridine2605 synthase